MMAEIFPPRRRLSAKTGFSWCPEPKHLRMPRGIPIQPLQALNFDMITLPPACMLVVGYARIIGFVSQGVGLFEVFK